MNRAKIAFALLVVFFAGCAASRLIVPPARAGTSPQRWEYTCPYVSHNDATAVAETANKFGAEGWEWSGVFGNAPAVCFKRPLP
jgi:hypothetical protein